MDRLQYTLPHGPRLALFAACHSVSDGGFHSHWIATTGGRVTTTDSHAVGTAGRRQQYRSPKSTIARNPTPLPTTEALCTS